MTTLYHLFSDLKVCSISLVSLVWYTSHLPLISDPEQAQSGQRFCPDTLRYIPSVLNFLYFIFASSHVVSLKPNRCNTRSIPSPRLSCRTAYVSRKICADTCFCIPAFSAVWVMSNRINRCE